MITATLINPTYSYQKDGVVSYSVTLEVYEDAAQVGTTGLSCQTSFLRQATDGSTEVNPEWDTNVQSQIKVQAEAYVNQYKFLMQLVRAKYPEALVPQDAVNTLTAAIVLEV